MATQSNLITAPLHNFKVYEGDTTAAVLTFTVTGTGDPIDMSGKNIVMEIRDKVGDPDVIETFSTTSGDITVSGIDNNIVTIAGWERLTKGKYVYDLEVTEGTDVVTYIRGKISVTQDVTE